MGQSKRLRTKKRAILRSKWPGTILILFILCGLSSCDWSKKVHGTINNQDLYNIESENCKIQLSCVPSHGNIDMLYIYITCCPGSTINIDSLQLSISPRIRPKSIHSRCMMKGIKYLLIKNPLLLILFQNFL